MKRSNIFAYIELSKLVGELQMAGTSEKLKEKLKSQSAYFRILEPKYFSDSLTKDWEGILHVVKQNGVKVNVTGGKPLSNALYNTIEGFTYSECQILAEQIYAVFEKMKQEFI